MGPDWKDKFGVHSGARETGETACAQALGTEGSMACSRNCRKARARKSVTGKEA